MTTRRDLHDPTDPASLQPEQRLTEVAAILGAGEIQITGWPRDKRGLSNMGTVILRWSRWTSRHQKVTHGGRGVSPIPAFLQSLRPAAQPSC